MFVQMVALVTLTHKVNKLAIAPNLLLAHIVKRVSFDFLFTKAESKIKV
jgi:hypothetical protein